MDKPFDRRVIRTRKLLQDALLQLILEQGYDSIRVQDITDKANLGRATFYVHYADKAALLFAAIESLSGDLEDHLQKKAPDSLLPGFRILFQHAADHPTFYRVVFDQVGGRQHIARAMTQKVSAALQRLPIEAPVPVEFLTHYIVGAVLQLLDWWLANDKPYNIEEMEIMLYKILRNGLPGIAGLQFIKGS